MSERNDADVLIVGAGPVGLTLGIDLAQRGVAVTIAEIRAADEPPVGRSNVVSARSMEAFRRLGIARHVREAGLPADYPHDVAIRTSATGLELGRVKIPCRADRYTSKDGPDTWWPTPEPPHRVNQIFLEPVLLAAAAAAPRLRIVRGMRVEDIEQRENEALAEAIDLASGARTVIAARYVVGCDGAHSRVRRAIGAVLHGDAAVLQVQTSVIRAPDLLAMMPGPAWAIDCINPRNRGLVFAIDGRERWIVHKFAAPGTTMPSDREGSVRDILGVGPSFAFETLGRDDWVGRRMLADRFRDRRVFLCGDAAHIWVPFAAYGMNAGIADAMNLAWMLAGVIKGWADPALLDAYEIERRPITEQVSRHAMRLATTWERRYGKVPETIEEPGHEGDAVRARIGVQATEIMAEGMCCGGLNFGYFYNDSPIIAYDGEAAPSYTMAGFTQSTIPGCRTPHLWLRDGRSLYDALGPDFTLLRLDPRTEVERLVEAAARRRLPMTVLDVNSEEAAALYPRKLLLSRPDRHVAWRGDQPPDDPLALIDRVRGALRPPHSRALACLSPDFGWRGFVSPAERPVEVGEIRESEIERN
ncbi:MAG: FAD-dependent monooxygenase [Hyphomicrobiales bacterium]|nr:FAD-dependent monooxygenase [Hyphomicrobiales bacterium]